MMLSTLYLIQKKTADGSILKDALSDVDAIKKLSYENKNLKITALMKIKLQKRYKPDKFTFDRLKSEYGNICCSWTERDS